MHVTIGRTEDYADPTAGGASTAYTKRLSEMAARQADTKAAERKRLWIAAVKSVKRSRRSRNSALTLTKSSTEAARITTPGRRSVAGPPPASGPLRQ